VFSSDALVEVIAYMHGSMRVKFKCRKKKKFLSTLTVLCISLQPWHLILDTVDKASSLLAQIAGCWAANSV
jgi:hypothetical protein